MMRSFRLIACSFCISFLGSLPVGTLNISVSQLAVAHRNAAAVEFGIGAILIEVLLVRLALTAIDGLNKLKRLFKYFRILTIAVLVTIAISCLKAAWQHQSFEASVPELSSLHPLAAGLLLSLLNPLHIPFWMGWTAVLRSKHILDRTSKAYNSYIVGIGSGTALAFAGYGIAGTYLQAHIQQQQPLINAAVGLALLGTAILQACKRENRPCKGPIPPFPGPRDNASFGPSKINDQIN